MATIRRAPLFATCLAASTVACCALSVAPATAAPAPTAPSHAVLWNGQQLDATSRSEVVDIAAVSSLPMMGFSWLLTS